MPYRKSSPPHPLLAILFAGCCACAAQATTLYRWVDSTGITHWSDRPTPGSTAVEMGAAQGYPAPAVPASNATSPRAGAVHFVLYSDVAITAPAPGGVLYDTGGVVLCALRTGAAVEVIAPPTLEELEALRELHARTRAAHAVRVKLPI